MNVRVLDLAVFDADGMPEERKGIFQRVFSGADLWVPVHGDVSRICDFQVSECRPSLLRCQRWQTSDVSKLLDRAAEGSNLTPASDFCFVFDILIIKRNI